MKKRSRFLHCWGLRAEGSPGRGRSYASEARDRDSDRDSDGDKEALETEEWDRWPEVCPGVKKQPF